MIPFQFAGQTGEHQSQQFSGEIIRNMYLVRSESNERIGSIVFPGLKSFGTGTAEDRGHHNMSDVHYVVNGSELYSESSSGTRTLIGSLSGADRVIFADDGTNLMMVANNTLYRYDGTSLSVVSQSVISNVQSVDYINRQFVITGDEQKFAISDVDDPTTYNALNFDFEKTSPDTLLAAYVFDQLVYMIGNRSIIPWYNTGVGNPPLARQETSLINVGCAGKYAITNTEAYLYVFGSDRKFYQITGASARSINTSGISYPIHTFSVVDDCVLSAFVWQGQTFVMAKFGSENATFLYSETNSYWVELGAGTEPDVRKEYFGTDAVTCYDKVLMCDYRNGNTYELDEETYTDNGETRLWVRDLPTFTGALIGAPDRQILVDRLQLDIQKGVGLVSGQGSDPRIMCEWSNDGGMSYGAQQFVEIGAAGSHYRSVDFYDFTVGYDVKARIMGSDPVQICIWGGKVSAQDGGY